MVIYDEEANLLHEFNSSVVSLGCQFGQIATLSYRIPLDTDRVDVFTAGLTGYIVGQAANAEKRIWPEILLSAWLDREDSGVKGGVMSILQL